MKLRTTGELVLLTLSIVLGSPLFVKAAQVTKPAPGASERARQETAVWQLAGREGECAPLSILGKKGPAYASIKSPADLAEKLRANGHKTEVKEFKAGTRPAVEVRAPSAGIHVMFVKQELCDKPPPAADPK
ncbi:MAG: hypothetical protein ACREQO_09565 [Candidatus Binatia bacterium]